MAVASRFSVHTMGAGPIVSVLLALAALAVPAGALGQPSVQPPTTLFALHVAGNVVTLRWDPPETGPEPTGYVLEGGLNAGEVLASISTGSVATVHTFVAPTGSFFVRAHSLNGAERSIASNEIRIHVNVPVVPAPPANLVGLVNGSNLALTWWNNYGGGTPTSLLLDVTGSLATTLPLPLAEAFSFPGVPGGTYTLQLRAVNAAGVSVASNPVTLTFPGPCSGPPEPPVAVLAYRLGNTIYMWWGPAISGPAPTGFVVNVSGDFTGSFATTARAISGAAGPGTYVLNVTATNACGTSGPSGTRVVTIP